eukprot:CAMPEP_0197592526 /NCGR_PEP_ID=MMETSP1326-20131121/15140_1 /TAXON_ID=1155430 /ORGANISM="Genus nov. species nov., Strain RCC2288" /LENGTH=173 /DNA_ID=CAMNT_0043158231 /DNA_START=48 /DNA_END=565 /DNA_ORIENTATION=-
MNDIQEIVRESIYKLIADADERCTNLAQFEALVEGGVEVAAADVRVERHRFQLDEVALALLGGAGGDGGGSGPVDKTAGGNDGPETFANPFVGVDHVEPGDSNVQDSNLFVLGVDASFLAKGPVFVPQVDQLAHQVALRREQKGRGRREGEGEWLVSATANGQVCGKEDEKRR